VFLGEQSDEEKDERESCKERRESIKNKGFKLKVKLRDEEQQPEPGGPEGGAVEDPIFYPGMEAGMGVVSMQAPLLEGL
jgi:hypothetical protein